MRAWIVGLVAAALAGCATSGSRGDAPVGDAGQTQQVERGPVTPQGPAPAAGTPMADPHEQDPAPAAELREQGPSPATDPHEQDPAPAAETTAGSVKSGAKTPPRVKHSSDGRCEPTPKAGDPCRPGDGYCVLSWGEPGGYSEALWCRDGRWSLEQERNLER